MALKRLFVPIPASVENDAEIDLALAAAKALDACVEVVFIEPPVQLPLAGGETARVSSAVGVHMTRQADERKKRSQEAQDRFARACEASGVRLMKPDEDVGALPAASWQAREGTYAEISAERAAAFDLVVASSAAVADSLKEIAEVSLLQTRRPVLLAPSRRETEFTAPAMVAWDESPQCWHAVSAAIPFLSKAASVQVVSVDKNATARNESQQELLRYLRCHGIEATANVMAPQSRSIGDNLLALAAEARAGLLVMGAYSHSRLREMLIGGVTRHILTNAAATPVLMAH